MGQCVIDINIVDNAMGIKGHHADLMRETIKYNQQQLICYLCTIKKEN